MSVEKDHPTPWHVQRYAPERGDPPAVIAKDANDVWLFDTINSSVSVIATEHDEDGAVTWDKGGEELFDRAVACVNFLAGVPTETIVACTRVEGQRQNEAAAMFLRFLMGDGLAALTYADEVQAQARLKDGERFVSRHDMEGDRATILEAMTLIEGWENRLMKGTDIPNRHALQIAFDILRNRYLSFAVDRPKPFVGLFADDPT